MDGYKTQFKRYNNIKHLQRRYEKQKIKLDTYFCVYLGVQEPT